MKLAANLAISALLLGAACAKKDAPPAADSTVAVTPTKVSTAEGFSTPESVLWDPTLEVWFVSNINGSPSARDGNGFISRLNRDGAVDSLHFIMSGRGGVTLNAPKGMAITGDTLWVSDIDAVRGFNRRTGAPGASVDFSPQKAKFLNDVAVGPDGALYITDTGILFDDKGGMTHPGPDAVFALKDRQVSVALQGDFLANPNGITWDGAAGHFVVVPFGGAALLGWKPGETKVDTLGSGPGQHDGVEILGGEVLVSSWADSSVFAVSASGNRKLVTGVQSPADIGVDQVRGLLAIPVFLGNRVEVWKVK